MDGCTLGADRADKLAYEVGECSVSHSGERRMFAGLNPKVTTDCDEAAVRREPIRDGVDEPQESTRLEIHGGSEHSGIDIHDTGRARQANAVHRHREVTGWEGFSDPFDGTVIAQVGGNPRDFAHAGHFAGSADREYVDAAIGEQSDQGGAQGAGGSGDNSNAVSHARRLSRSRCTCIRNRSHAGAGRLVHSPHARGDLPSRSRSAHR